MGSRNRELELRKELAEIECSVKLASMDTCVSADVTPSISLALDELQYALQMLRDSIGRTGERLAPVRNMYSDPQNEKGDCPSPARSAVADQLFALAAFTNASRTELDLIYQSLEI